MKILTIEDYRNAMLSLDVDPLICGWDDKESMVYLPIQLRVEIQGAKFYSKTRTGELQKFYRWCWEKKGNICEETGMYLLSYSAKYISHILTRGAHYEKSTDPRNINILSVTAHREWEEGNRKEMRIYWKNQKTILLLNREYFKLRPKNLK